MKAKQAADTDQAHSSKVAVFARHRALPARGVIVYMVLIAAVVVGIVAFEHYHHSNNDQLYAAEQRTLQTSLAIALSQSNYQNQVEAISQLISGKEAGHFTVDSKTLAQYYMERGVAYINLKQYSKAVPDFAKARSLDSTLAQASLQGEVQARYDLGQRQELIPLFRQLAVLTKDAVDTRIGTPELYQHYIDVVQHNQELQLQ